MSVIIRLQNLPLSAKAQDIRQYFNGLNIPEGGVRIVGGKKGDAFITFSTEEDATQAFNLNYGKIKDVQITLMHSSHAEMLKVIEKVRIQSVKPVGVQLPSVVPMIPAPVPSTTSTIANIFKKEDHVISKVSSLSSMSRSSSRSTSRERRDRKDRRRRRHDRSRSPSRDRSKIRRRRSRSRSREHRRRRSRSKERRNTKSRSRESSSKTETSKTHQDEICIPPDTALPAESLKLLNLVLPNIIFENSQLSQLLTVANLTQQLQLKTKNSSPKTSNKSVSKSTDVKSGHINSLDVDQDSDGHNDPACEEIVNESPRNLCVKIEPFYGNIKDILNFFSGFGLKATDIYIPKNKSGGAIGIAYANFRSRRCRDKAVVMSRSLIHNIEVKISPIDFETFIREVVPHTTDSNALYLKIDGLPDFVNGDIVREIFRKYCINTIAIEPKGRLKSAYIKFNRLSDTTNALNESHFHIYEGILLDIEKCSEKDFNNIASLYGTDPVQLPGTTISIMHLPLATSVRDIMDFFSDLGIIPSKINLKASGISLHNGAICEFDSISDANFAMQKNYTLFGKNKVIMKYVSNNQNATMKTEGRITQTCSPANPVMMQMPLIPKPSNNAPPFIQGSNQFNFPPQRIPMPMINNQMCHGMAPNLRMSLPRLPPQILKHKLMSDEDTQAPPGCTLLLTNLPYNAAINDILNFLGNDIPVENLLRKFNDDGQPTGEAKVIFNSPQAVYHRLRQCVGRRMRERYVTMAQI